MSRKRRAITLIGTVLVVAGCAAAGASPSSAPASSESTGPTDQSGSAGATAEATQHVSADSAAFDVPAGWHTRPGTINPSGNRTVVFVGPQDLPTDCVEGAQGGVCYSWPVTRLVAGGIVIAWRVHGLPGSRPPDGGDAILVGGRPARVVRGPADAACAALGGDESVAVAIVPRAGETGWAGLDACLAGPFLGPAEATFRRILGSVTWAPG